MNSDDEPAFPRDHAADGHNGMTLRDYFAAKAMQAILTGAFAQGRATEPEDAPPIAQGAWLMADAMLAERQRAKAPKT